MNAPHRHFAKASVSTSALGAMAGACAGLLLSGCASHNPFATAAVDPTSPVAEEVARVARSGGDFPTFADIPAVPTDQRPIQQWGQSAGTLVTERAALERQTAPNTWTLSGTERFQARAKADAGPPIQGEAASSTAATEAFARQLRERATPPPSPR